MNIIQLLKDYNIPYHEEGKNISAGWIGLSCPHCNDTSTHMGYNLDGNYFTCWRCGGHSIPSTLSALLGITNYKKVKEIIKQYSSTIALVEELKTPIQKHPFKLPSNSEPLQKQHKAYLEGRGFDPDYLEKLWGLKGTGVYSKLDNIDYRFRIVIPFVWGGRVVSFDTRDITGKDQGRYKACPKERELISHKEIIYGKQELFKRSAICVEGPTDCWRFGSDSFAVSGIKYTNTQLRVIAQTFKRVAVCFDGEEQAQTQAAKMVAELRFRKVDAFTVDIEGDPGAMNQSEADYLVKQLI